MPIKTFSDEGDPLVSRTSCNHYINIRKGQLNWQILLIKYIQVKKLRKSVFTD